ncbi:MAG: PaaI family thioesterase [Thermodesulfobacteriota bacterium]
MDNKSNNKEIIEEISQLLDSVEFFKTLGVEVIEFSDGNSVLKLPFHKKLTQPFGFVHGGALFSLADGACAYALLSVLNQKKPFVTVEMKINYLEPVKSGDTYAYAKVLRQGRVVPIEVELKNSEKLVAKAISTYIILDSIK